MRVGSCLGQNILVDYEVFSHNKQILRLRASKFISNFKADILSQCVLRPSTKYLKVARSFNILLQFLSKSDQKRLWAISSHFSRSITHLKVPKFNPDFYLLRQFTKLISLVIPHQDQLNKSAMRAIKSLKLKSLNFTRASLKGLSWLRRTRSLESITTGTPMREVFSPELPAVSQQLPLKFNLKMNIVDSYDKSSINAPVLELIDTLELQSKGVDKFLPKLLAEGENLRNLKKLKYKARKVTLNPSDKDLFRNLFSLEEMELEVEEWDPTFFKVASLPKHLKKISILMHGHIDDLGGYNNEMSFFDSLYDLRKLVSFEIEIKEPDVAQTDHIMHLLKLFLRPLKNLEALKIKIDNINLKSLEVLNMIFQQKTLQDLHIDSKTPFTSERIDSVKNFEGKLKKLTLTDNLFLLESFNNAAINDIDSLSVTLNNIDQCEKTIVSTLNRVEKLSELNISDRKSMAMPSESIMEIFEATKHLKSLKKMSIDACTTGLEDDHLEKVTNELKSRKSIKDVEINAKNVKLRKIHSEEHLVSTKSNNIYELDFVV